MTFQVIPNPRCINGVRDQLAKNKYKDPLQAYEDLNLVFLNAVFYNEDVSQIAKDAKLLKVRSLLPGLHGSILTTCIFTVLPSITANPTDYVRLA